jgi:hypothetical protein
MQTSTKGGEEKGGDNICTVDGISWIQLCESLFMLCHRDQIMVSADARSRIDSTEKSARDRNRFVIDVYMIHLSFVIRFSTSE